MTRIVVGNRDGALALSQARTIVAELTSEWPDINLVQKTVASGAGGDTAALLGALERNQLSIAVVSLERLPGKLPEGIALASVTRRLEARSTLIAKGVKELGSLPEGARIGVPSARGAQFLKATAPALEAVQLNTGGLDDNLRRLAEGDVAGLVLPASLLIGLDRRSQIETLLEAELFPPAVGQGSLGLLVREDDDAAMELAYTLQHRPSFDRANAERSFATALEESSAAHLMQQDGVPAIGALATVTGDGELTLFGAVVAASGNMLQATTGGDASEAADLGRELAADFKAQLEKIN